MKLILIIIGFLFYRELLIRLVGYETTVAFFVLQAIYCRIRYFRNSQMMQRIPILYPEVMGSGHRSIRLH